MLDLRVKIGGLTLKNPVLTASGTFGYGNEFNRIYDVSLLGGIVTKSVSRYERKGNPPERVVETASGMINAIGLANVGVEKFVSEKLPFLQNLKTSVVANIVGSTLEEYVEVTEILEEQKGIAAYEINLSCPNVKGGIRYSTDPKFAFEMVSAIRKVIKSERPLIAKLTPNVTSVSEIAIACENAGASSVSLINTLVGMAVDVQTRKPKIKNITGGLSGPAIKPVALAKVWEVAKIVKIPVIGIGGILTWEDAVEFLIVGASAVQVGTANFINPNAPLEILCGIENYLSENKINLSDLVGSLLLN
ncbi:dihydroorotate dehydrogenase [bacterium]|nr:dihydroorotate dehydrogenase [bacterium]